MKYNQPYGVSDPNAAYINGNPSTGTMGSIPPAASIEHPQREIVDIITRSGLTPSSADLSQLSRGVQSGLINYAVDAGTPSAYAVTLNPPPLQYYQGLPVRMKVINAPIGASTLNVNGLGPKPITKRNQKPVQAFDFYPGDVVLLIYDGATFQLIGSQAAPLLAAPMIYYVATTGSDSNDGLTAQAPFLTVQHAIDVISTFNLNGYNVVVYVANGTYPAFSLTRLNGSGSVSIIGNESNPSVCTISAANTFGGSAVMCIAAGYALAGFTFTTPGPVAPFFVGAGIWVGAGGVLTIQNCNFGPCGNASTAQSYWIANDGGYIGCYKNITVSGGTLYGFTGLNNGQFRTSVPDRPTLVIAAPVTVGYFAYALNGGVVAQGWASITGAGNVTGARYIVGANGIIDTVGGGPNYLPGTSPGFTQTGGQYV